MVSVRHGLVSAVRELGGNLSSGGLLKPDTERDIPTWSILGLGVGCTMVLALVNYRFTGGVGITVLATLVMLIMGFFFTGVASYIVGLVGNSNSPVSGMTITAVLVYRRRMVTGHNSLQPDNAWSQATQCFLC